MNCIYKILGAIRNFNPFLSGVVGKFFILQLQESLCLWRLRPDVDVDVEVVLNCISLMRKPEVIGNVGKQILQFLFHFEDLKNCNPYCNYCKDCLNVLFFRADGSLALLLSCMFCLGVCGEVCSVHDCCGSRGLAWRSGVALKSQPCTCPLQKLMGSTSSVGGGWGCCKGRRLACIIHLWPH